MCFLFFVAGRFCPSWCCCWSFCHFVRMTIMLKNGKATGKHLSCFAVKKTFHLFKNIFHVCLLTLLFLFKLPMFFPICLVTTLIYKLDLSNLYATNLRNRIHIILPVFRNSFHYLKSWCFVIWFVQFWLKGFFLNLVF